ncbi:MAG: hypothetical protein AB1515_01645 [Nitrospirota bacterium]
MKRFLAVALTTLLYGFGLAGCGDDAGFEAIIVVVTGDLDVALIGPGSFGVAGGVLFKVQRAADDPTPVPNVKMTLYADGANGFTTMFLDPGGTVPAGNGFVYSTATNDEGVVHVFPTVTTSACPGTTDFEGEGNISAVISTDQQAWVGSFTVDCSP